MKTRWIRSRECETVRKCREHGQPGTQSSSHAPTRLNINIVLMRTTSRGRGKVKKRKCANTNQLFWLTDQYPPQILSHMSLMISDAAHISVVVKRTKTVPWLSLLQKQATIFVGFVVDPIKARRKIKWHGILIMSARQRTQTILTPHATSDSATGIFIFILI